jgi:hypothetical protein
MTTLEIVLAVWISFSWAASTLFYMLAKRDVAAARRLRDQALLLAGFAEARGVHVSDVDAAIALAMQEREGACLQ